MQSVVNATRRVVCSGLHIRADRSLLADFSWQHAPGGIAWLLGSNGSGKSSLLRVLAGWQAPAEGTVAWAGAPAERRYYFNPAMSAGADLRVAHFMALVNALAPPVRNDDLAALYPQSVGANKRFGQLSTGEAKRILLWALLRPANGPLLLDEPYEHLSRDAKDALTRVLRARAADDVVIVATNQDVAGHTADTLLTFDGDRIEVRHAD